MNNRIFEAFAPLYWAACLPVIPLREMSKKPAINQWSIYGTRMPDANEQALWLHSFPKGNIGLPLGTASGLATIDIDTEDQGLIDAILDVLPKSPWVRVGKKGMALAYRFEGQKNFKLRGADGGMILEFLGQGNQVVVPPSIHPDTGRPYTANANLWEVLDQIPLLGEDIEDKLRALLGAKGFEIGAGGRSAPLEVVPAGERDVQMVRHAGYLARVVLGIDKSANFSLWDAILHMHTWVEQFTAKVSGDAMDPNKGVAKLLEFLIKDLEKGRTMPEGWDANLPDEWRDHPELVRIAELNDRQRWDLAKARRAFLAKYLEDRSANGAVAAVKWILTSVASDPHFDEFAETALISYIKETCGEHGFDRRQLRRLANELRKTSCGTEAESHAQIAKAVLTDLERYGEIRHDQGQFWQWNGSCFAPLDEAAIYRHIIETVTDKTLVKRHNDYNAIIGVLETITKRPLVTRDSSGINFANGWVNAELKVVDHNPDFGATFTLPFEFRADAGEECPQWLGFLASCWGHEPDYEQRVLALQEAFAATLFGIAPKYQRAILLFGKGGTGKTQILKVLRAMMPPEAVAELGPQQWGERFQLTHLIGKTANICGELPETGVISGNVFKEVVEGSPMATEFKGKDGFTFIPKAAHWFASNYLPVSRDSTWGFARRWLIFEFNKKVAAEDRIENFAEMIVAEEREAIAAWALWGVQRLGSQRDYTLPESHAERQDQLRRINNSVHAFLEDSREFARGEGSVKARELFDSYGFHMRDVRRSQGVSFERFLQMLEDLDLEIHRDAIGDYVVAGLQPVKGAAA